MMFVSIYSTVVLAGNAEDLFGGGVFSVDWGSSLEDVKEIFPKGKVKDSSGVILYKVKDGRDLFGFDRKNGEYITFGFDTNGSLNSLSIEFSGKLFDDLMYKFIDIFGPLGEGAKGIELLSWSEESGITISLAYIPGMFGADAYVGISKSTVTKKVSKESLGF